MQGNWRDLLAFNKRERNGIFVLTTLIVLVLLVQFSLPYFIHPKTDFEEPNLEAYLIQLKKDSAEWVAQNRKKYTKSKTNYASVPKSSKRTKKIKFNPHEFEPNHATTSDWESVGLSKKQAQSIQRYVDKGGKFKVKADVAKMYVITEQKFDEMKPYLLLPDSVVKPKPEPKKAKTVFVSKPYTYDTIIVELNTADTTELKKLRGIGSYYARKIVYYREKLGGFHSVEQLYEIERMREETVQSIAPFLTVDTTLIRKLHINKDDAPVLVKHPYITWNMAKRIQDYRDFSHRFKSPTDLIKKGLLTEELYSKLVPYIEL